MQPIKIFFSRSVCQLIRSWIVFSCYDNIRQTQQGQTKIHSLHLEKLDANQILDCPMHTSAPSTLPKSSTSLCSTSSTAASSGSSDFTRSPAADWISSEGWINSAYKIKMIISQLSLYISVSWYFALLFSFFNSFLIATFFY